MELLSFLLMVLVPLGFLAWAFTKRGLLAGISIPFIIMLFFPVMALNSDPVLTWPVTQLGCPSVPLNTTSTFVEIATDRTSCYDVQTENFALPVHSLIPVRVEYASSASSSIVDQTIQCIDVPLRKFGNPSVAQLVNAGVWDNTGTLVKQFGAGLNVTEITSSSVYKTFCLSNGELYTIQNDDRIGIGYTGGDASNYIELRGDSNNPFDGTITFIQTFASGAWSSQTTNDLRMTLYRGENQTTTTGTATNTPAACTYITTDVPHELDPTALLIVTYTAMIGQLILAFVVLLRVKDGLKARKQLKESEQ